MSICDVVISFGISCYASLVIGRYLIFYQEIQRARDAVMGLVNRWHIIAATTKETDANEALLWMLTGPAMAVKRQGHFRASIALHQLNESLRAETLAIWKDLRAVTDESGWDVTFMRMNPLHASAIKTVDSISPSYLAVFLGEYLTRSLLNVIPASWWRK